MCGRSTGRQASCNDCVHAYAGLVALVATRDPRDWLIANDGDALPASVIAEITRTSGSVRTDAWRWVTGFHLSDAAVDCIEEVANGETPAAGSDG